MKQHVSKTPIRLFITATDTDAGKTYAARLITRALVNAGNSVAVYKPISAGCELIDDQWVNEDAALLQQAANCQQNISEINPIAFEQPIAPHIAAATLGESISVSEVEQHYQAIEHNKADILLTEGAGGWRLPLGNGEFLSSFAKRSKQKVVLVVNMKLGCLNHAVLTHELIEADGLVCIGWIANCQRPDMPYLKENIAELEKLLPMAKLAELTFEHDIDKQLSQLNVNQLISPLIG